MSTTTPMLATRVIRRAEGRCYLGMALSAMAIAIAGFGPAIVDASARTAPLTLAVGAHGAVVNASLPLFVTQTILIPM